MTLLQRWRHGRQVRKLLREAAELEAKASAEQRDFDAHMRKMAVGSPFYVQAFHRLPDHLSPASFTQKCASCGYRGPCESLGSGYRECPQCHEPLLPWWRDRKRAKALRAEAEALRKGRSA